MTTTLNERGSGTAKKHRFHLITDIHLLLLKGDSVLLGKRANTGYGDGAYHLPSGHLEAGESVVEGLIRETKEEIGITVEPQNVIFGHVMHNVSGEGRIAFFFAVSTWDGEPANMEPEKCSELRWFQLRTLPSEMIEYARTAIHYYVGGKTFSTYGS